MTARGTLCCPGCGRFNDHKRSLMWPDGIWHHERCPNAGYAEEDWPVYAGVALDSELTVPPPDDIFEDDDD